MNPLFLSAARLCASQFQLNDEQERAFFIVANHMTNPYAMQLKMYIGGPAGTGKSQVLKALMSFLESQGRKHEFLILAPTGSAAALLNGSTYHSALNINDYTHDQNYNQLSEDVRYIFIDEISMISGCELYRISERLALALNTCDIPFGG
ncbi:hypothetical protein BDN72DRAFT_776049, partial [Pluteus cervinus]